MTKRTTINTLSTTGVTANLRPVRVQTESRGLTIRLEISTGWHDGSLWGLLAFPWRIRLLLRIHLLRRRFW